MAPVPARGLDCASEDMLLKFVGGRLSHPNVIAVYEAGTLETGVFIATEFVEGVTLQRWLNQAPRTRRQILDVFLAAGEGLAAAHRAGLVHRDFKPENVMVGADGRVRVTDFGIAQFAASDDDAEAPGETPLDGGTGERLVGTPKYMAPEQLEGDAVDARTDVFSFC